MSKDLYEILGVSRSATDQEIKKAYRQLARKHHPDVNPGDGDAERRFKEISAAYAVLKDSEKRRQYDQFGSAAFSGGGGPGGFDFSDIFNQAGGGFGDASGFGDIFESLFGGGMGRGRSARQAGPTRGADLHYTLELSFDECFSGADRELSFRGASACGECNGYGYPPGSPPETCPDCRGTGSQTARRGPLNISQPCRACGGQGRRATKTCTKCRGAGKTDGARRINVKIPAGVDAGSKVRVGGKGDPGTLGGPAGDLIISIKTREHPLFVRKGNNLHLEAPITFVEAAMGAYIEIPTPEGRAELRVPPGTDSGQTFRLRGKGFPALHDSRRGDMYVKVKIVTPKKLSGRARDLLNDFSAAMPQDPRAGLRSMGK